MVEQTAAQILGREGERWFESNVPAEWAYEPPRTDLGLDGRIAIGTNTDIGKFQFSVQIKAQRRCQSNSRGYVAVPGVKRATVLYWASSLLPTLIVLYDASKQAGYYSWLPEALPRPDKFLASSRKTVTLQVSTKQVLNRSCWHDVSREVERHYRWVAGSLEKARTSDLFLPTLNSLAKAAQGLGRVQTWSAVATEELSADLLMTLQALSLLELLSHREAYCGLLELAEILRAEHRAGKLAATGARYYRELLEDCYYPLNEALKKRSDTFAIWSNPEKTARALPKALELLHELLVELTGGRDLPDASTTKGNRLGG